jgi:hypothetical protein
MSDKAGSSSRISRVPWTKVSAKIFSRPFGPNNRWIVERHPPALSHFHDSDPPIFKNTIPQENYEKHHDQNRG